MRHDQERRQDGQFGTIDDRHRMFEEERLEYPIGCKVTQREVRMYSILFDQHRKVWGWQTMSDMYRDLLRDGFKAKAKELASPTPEMTQMLLETEQMELAKASTAVHLHHERAIEVTGEQIELLKRTNDFGRIRKILVDFYEKTKQTKDPVIRRRRTEEMERRGWDRMLKDLCRGVSLTKFEDED